MNPGDVVTLRLAREELTCTVLESSDPSIVLVKLSSGYNIGIPKDHVLDSKVVKTFQGEKKTFKLEQNSALPKVGLIITGGTIAAKLDARTGGTKWLTDVNEFLSFYPGMSRIAQIKTIDVPFMMASESMTSEQWSMIASSVKKMVDDPEISGVIVTHGTDFLGYTGAALSFFLQNLTKPVVLTYSQRSIDRGSSDADLNLQCAARMATSDCAEVCLVGHATENDDYCYALRATKVKKLHTSRRDAFKPINTEPLAKVWPEKVAFLGTFKARHSGTTELDASFSDKVALVKFYPGQSPDVLDFYALKYKGIIVEASGLGHLPVSESATNWIPTLKKHIKKGFVVCAASQTMYGRLNPLVYSNGRELANSGVIFLEDMLAETALVKLGWVLGHYGWKKHVAEKMLENVAGEFNPLLTA